jgi:hypothetical protein
MGSFDERSHSYLGYVLRVEGTREDEPGGFLIAIGKAAQAKHRFQAGMEASGQAVPVPDPRLETAGFFKASGLKILRNTQGDPPAGPPFHLLPPDLETYRSRGHRRLDTRTYDAKCTTCIWGCRMPVEMIIDHWNPSKKRYRFGPFVTARKAAHFTGPDRHARCRGERGCPTSRRKGSTKTQPPTGGRMIERLES